MNFNFKKYLYYYITIFIIIIGLGLGLGLGFGLNSLDADQYCIIPKCIVGTQCKINVACVGDSITWGYGVKNTQTIDSYPAQLQQLLGQRYFVCNSGSNGATIGRNSKSNYYSTMAFKNLTIGGLPDIIIFQLGTNDTWNWISQDYFENETIFLINQLLKINSNPRIFISLPPPMFCNRISNYKNIFIPYIITGLKNIAIKLNLPIIDVNHSFAFIDPILGNPTNYIEYFPDCLHPNKTGNAIIANTVYNAII